MKRGVSMVVMATLLVSTSAFLAPGKNNFTLSSLVGFQKPIHEVVCVTNFLPFPSGNMPPPASKLLYPSCQRLVVWLLGGGH